MVFASFTGAKKHGVNRLEMRSIPVFLASLCFVVHGECVLDMLSPAVSGCIGFRAEQNRAPLNSGKSRRWRRNSAEVGAAQESANREICKHEIQFRAR